jgi:hypothetical protein
MDAKGFDRIARSWASGSRRHLVRGLAATAAAAVVVPRPSTGAACTGLRTGEACSSDAACCSGQCSANLRGTPATYRCCLAAGERCRKGSQCCSGRCNRHTGRCQCPAGTDRVGGRCQERGGACAAGVDSCDGAGSCGGGGSCFCLRDPRGVPRCVDSHSATTKCAACTRDADCDVVTGVDGSVCVFARADCLTSCPTTGTACYAPCGA